ncbi:cell wall-binding repeat-containing protein [Compostimonas suwonensis]|uniref:Putative cell wall binding repeat protein n=1 Tax=Compostimonas suwonensis TaxID=1048394 RepID=A0A2M9BUX3_9MICO|nr:cell wall-binding repeat-containing protein [Compostimonas suwonensis]PJJ61753.1 putative cell wall binding repeat protein [Compostimonas suwonensis]
MSRMEPRTGRMSRLTIALAAVIVALLAAVGLTAPARAAGTLSISGTVSLQGGGEGTPYVEVYAADDGGWAGSFSGADYSIGGLEPGSYRVRARVFDFAHAFVSTWYGNTPIESVSTTVTLSTGSATGVDIVAARGGAISGHVGLPSGLGVDTSLEVNVFLHNEAGDEDWWMGSASPSASGDYSIGQLPPGEYYVRFSGGQFPRVAASFYPDVVGIQEADLVPVTAGETASDIDTVMTPWWTSSNRIAGTNRYETSAAVAFDFDAGVETVYVASGENWPDALSAGPAAAHFDAPLLLVPHDTVPVGTLEGINRLNPKRIVVVGGLNAISENVVGALREVVRDGGQVDRISGADRYGTSRAVVTDAFGTTIPSKDIYLASGSNYPDALSAGSAAGVSDSPVLLVDGGARAVDAATDAFLRPTEFRRIVIVGGEAVFTTALRSDLERFSVLGNSYRIGGVDRFDTNAKVIDWGFGHETWRYSGVAIVASGFGFADALSAVPLAGRYRGPVLLSQKACIPSAALDSAWRVDMRIYEVIGGEAVLDRAVEQLARCDDTPARLLDAQLDQADQDWPGTGRTGAGTPGTLGLPSFQYSPQAR